MTEGDSSDATSKTITPTSTPTDNTSNNRLHPPMNDGKTRSPSNESIKSFEVDKNGKVGNGVMKTPLLQPKPRPWSVAGNEDKCDFSVDSSKTTPEALDNNDVVLIDGQSGGSIVGITPAALSSSIVGISPGKPHGFSNVNHSILPNRKKSFIFPTGAALQEKKSVKDMAAGLNRLGGKILSNIFYDFLDLR